MPMSKGGGKGLQLESLPGTRKASLVLYIHNLFFFANSASSSSGPAGIIGWVFFFDKLMIDVCIFVQSMVGKVLKLSPKVQDENT